MNPFLKINKITELILNSKHVKLLTDYEGLIQHAYALEKESLKFYPVHLLSGKKLADCTHLELVKKLLETLAIVREEQQPVRIPIQVSARDVLMQLDYDVTPIGKQKVLITLMHHRSDPEINMPPIPIPEKNASSKINLLHQAIHLLVDQMDDLCFAITPSGKFVYCNHVFQKLTGYSNEDLSHMNFSDLLPEYQKEIIAWWLNTPQKSHPKNTLLNIITKTGEEIQGTTKILVQQGDSQNLLIIGLFHRDQTGLSGLNETIYEQIIRVASRLSLPMLMIEDGSLKILFANSAAHQYYEFDEGELNVRNFLDLFPASENQNLLQLLRGERKINLESDYSWTQITRTGVEKKSRFIINHLILENQKISVILLRDPIPETNTHIIKEESENAYFHEQELLMVNLTPSGMITKVNLAFCEIIGKPVEKIIGKTFEEILFLEDYAEIYQHFSQLTIENPVRKNQNRIIDANGKTHWIEWTDRGIFSGKQLSEIQSLGKDITTSYQRESLQNSMEQRYQALVENLPMMTYVIHAKTLFPFYISPQVEELTGYKPEEFYKNPQIWTNAMPPEDAQKYYDLLQQRIEKKTTGPVEFQMIRRDGQPIWIEEFGSTIELSDGTILYQGTSRDVTERHINQEKLIFYSNFESAINEFSLKLLKATPENINEIIQFIVDELGKIMRVDRAYIFGFDHKERTMSNTFEWCHSGVSPMIDQLQNMHFSDYFWWMKRLNNHQEIVLNRVSELPPEAASEKENITAQGIKSLLAVPLICNGKVKGFIGFDMVNQETHWEQKSINLLRLISAMIMSTRERIINDLNGKEIRYHGNQE